MSQFEEALQEKYFPGIQFSDEREKQVFFSYIRGFSLLILDPSIKKVLEIGGGQSTTLLAGMGQRVGWEIFTIDLNPQAIALKIRSQSTSDETIENINFHKGVSINLSEILSFYERGVSTIGDIPFDQVLSASLPFIDTSMDARKAPKVAQALGLSEFNNQGVINSLMESKELKLELLNVFKVPGDEFEQTASSIESSPGCLREKMDAENIDVVFLDSGEFSSLPEWEIVNSTLRVGGYVILHDIFFPKSFKNWLVCSSIIANPNYETLFIDRSTPQGLMVAQKKS
jgi:hypothetical protein